MSSEIPKRPKRRQKRLNESQRYMIEHLWNEEHWTQTEIGRKLGYTQSSISRELDRGNVLDLSYLDRQSLLNLDNHDRIKYSAMRGQYLAIQKRYRLGVGLKLTPEMRALIEHWVNVEHWTPEQIAGNVQDIEVSSSTIRRWHRAGLIDIKAQNYHRQAKSKEKRPVAQTRIERQREIDRLRAQLKEQGDLKRHSIYERPSAVEKRQQFGHWEIDLVLSRKNNSGRSRDDTAIMTLIERKTRFYSLIKINSRKSTDVIAGFKLFWDRYGIAVRTITADNGSEFVSWDFLAYVQKELNVKLYYATPSAPQQRGTNENRNRKLRAFYPKGSSFRTVTQRMLDETSDKMNAMPMRIALNSQVPVEVFIKEYKAMKRYKRAYEKYKRKQAKKNPNQNRN
jgi:IS30 family transposase